MRAIEYQCFEGQPTAEVLDWLVAVNEATFGFNEIAEKLSHLFSTRSQVLICLAFMNGEPVGYKVGMEDGDGHFESWRGGVLEHARRQGIAQALMRLQHQWCAEQGFRSIRTSTTNNNAPMLILNLRNGFEVVGTKINQNQQLKVLQEKWL